MALSSFGSLGLRCSFRLDIEEDLPKLKKDRQLPTGDFLDFMGSLFLGQKNYKMYLFENNRHIIVFFMTA